MSSARGVTLAIGFVAVCACDRVQAPFEAGVGTVRGRVVSAGVGVEGASVWSHDVMVRTTSDGRFALADLPTGQAVVSAAHAGLGASRTARVVSDRALDLGDLVLEAGACAAGRVQRADGGLTSPVEVDLPILGRWTWTRADGRFELALPPGRHRVRFRGANLEDAELELEARAGCNPDDADVLMRSAPAAEPMVWLELERQPVPVGGAAVALDGPTLYVAGGSSCPDGACAATVGTTFAAYQVDALQRLDLRTGAWDLGPPMPAIRGGTRGAVLGDALYVVGGWRTGDGTCEVEQILPRGVECRASCRLCFLDEVFRYDLVEQRWQDSNDGVPRLPVALAFGGLVGDGRRLRYIGGIESGIGGYSSRIHTYEAGGTAWGVTAFDGRRVHNLAACGGAGELFAFAGAAYWPGEDGREVPPLCSARVTRHGLASGVSRLGAIAPLIPSSMTAGCAVVGDFLYVPMETKRASGHVTLRYGLRDDDWAVEPVVASEHYTSVGAASNLPGGAIATPHGLLVTGLGSDHAHHTGQVFAAVAERFLAEAEARYGRRRVSVELVAPELDVPDPGQWDSLCRLRGCGEACEGPEDDRCVPGHACLEGRCLPAACTRCPDRCELSPDDRPAPSEVRIEGARYLACTGARCRG